MGVADGLTTSVDLEPFTAAAESLVGVAVIPVSAAPIEIELGSYELSDNGRRGRDAAAPVETVRVPLAHTEGGLTASMTRGALAAGTVRTYVLHDRITRASCFVCTRPGAMPFRWHGGSMPSSRRCNGGSPSRTTPSLSKRARLREVKTHVVGPMCHALWAWTTGDAVGPNMMTRNSYALNMALRDAARADQARARNPRSQHGRRQEAVRTSTSSPVTAKRCWPRPSSRRADTARAANDRRRSRGALVGRHARRDASGMQSVAFTPASAIAAVFAATGQDLGMVGTSTMAHARPAASRAACIRRSASAGSRSAPSGRHDAALGPRLACLDRLQRRGHRLSVRADRRSGGAVSRDQRVRGDATAGSENFFQAHHERGGLR